MGQLKSKCWHLFFSSFFFFSLCWLVFLVSWIFFFFFLFEMRETKEEKRDFISFLLGHLTSSNLHMFCQVKDESGKLCGKGFRFFAESGGTHGTLFHPKDYSQIHCWCCSHHVLCACHVYFPRRRDTDGIEVPWGTGILDWGGVLKFRYPVCPCAGVVRKFKTLFGSQGKKRVKIEFNLVNCCV